MEQVTGHYHRRDKHEPPHKRLMTLLGMSMRIHHTQGVSPSPASLFHPFHFCNVLTGFKSFLLGSQDLKVNLCGLQQDIRSGGKSKKIVGIARQFPRYSYTVGLYGKGPTSDYTTCTYIASKYTAFSINNDRYLITWP